jgi:hypothetical protein
MAIAGNVHLHIELERGTRTQWCPARSKALALWPRLDRKALSRCGCDPARIARYVSRRTRIPADAIEHLLSETETV